MYHGDIQLGATIDIKFTTVQSTGAPTTLAGSPVISAYVDDGTTEITAGITLSVDRDSRTGMHNVRVVATAANGFAARTNIFLVITTGTVNSVSAVGYVIGSFSIQNRPAPGVRRGACTSTGTTTTIVDTSLTESATDHFKGRIVVFTSGTLKDQATDITAFTPGSDTLTVTALTSAPQSGDQYEIY